MFDIFTKQKDSEVSIEVCIRLLLSKYMLIATCRHGDPVVDSFCHPNLFSALLPKSQILDG